MWRTIGIVLIAAASAAAQAAGWDGTWKSDERYNGETRVIVVLKSADGKLGGTVTVRGVTDDDNNITTLNLAIQSAKVEGNSLSFETKMPDDNVVEWEMTMNGPTATAGMVGDRDGPYSDPQRWKLRRSEQ